MRRQASSLNPGKFQAHCKMFLKFFVGCSRKLNIPDDQVRNVTKRLQKNGNYRIYQNNENIHKNVNCEEAGTKDFNSQFVELFELVNFSDFNRIYLICCTFRFELKILLFIIPYHFVSDRYTVVILQCN